MATSEVYRGQAADKWNVVDIHDGSGYCSSNTDSLPDTVPWALCGSTLLILNTTPRVRYCSNLMGIITITPSPHFTDEVTEAHRITQLSGSPIAGDCWQWDSTASSWGKGGEKRKSGGGVYVWGKDRWL